MSEKFLILLSPAKNLAEKPINKAPTTKPKFGKQIATLIEELQTYSAEDIADLMHLSPKLAELNFKRFQTFNAKKFDKSNASQAIFTFNGHSYETLDASHLNDTAFEYLQSHLLILSGLYGYLRPTDLMQPYRLEMKTKLATPGYANLYEFWTELLTKSLNKLIEEQGYTHVLNCASIEYASAINFKQLSVPTITFKFQQKKDDKYKTIGIYSKKARGLMVRYLAETAANSIKTVQAFDLDGYAYDIEDSSNALFVYKKAL